jgi:hypothetical protein
MSIQSELLALKDTATGLIRAEEVLSWAAANPRSEIYRALEWDDQTAAYSHRLDQVRRLIVLHIRDESTGKPAVVSLSIDRVAGGGYRLHEDIRSDETLRSILLADALKELERIRAKYQHLQELVEVWRAADRVARGGRRGRGRRGGRAAA